MKWIGITGNLGSGKSTVSKMIRSMGYPVVDADQMARQALEPGSSLLAPIKERFGDEVFEAKGVLDRKSLGKRVFNSKEDLLWLESLVHPEVQRRVRNLRSELEVKGVDLAFYDVPLLFEKGLQKNFDQTAVVTAREDLLLARVAARDGLDEREIKARLSHQIPLDKKEQMANYVIPNNGSLEDLKREVEAFIHRLKAANP